MIALNFKGVMADAIPGFQWLLGVSHLEVLTANAFIRWNYEGIYLFHIPPSGMQSWGGNNELSTPSIIWSYRYDDARAPSGYGGLYYNHTDAVLPNLYVNNYRHSHIIEFGVDTLADAEHNSCAGYPVVLNHTVVPASGGSHDDVDLRRSKGRKGVYLGFDLDLPYEELLLYTDLLDDPDRRGHFRVALGQYELLGADEEWIKGMDHDEVTGRILFLMGFDEYRGAYEEYGETCGLFITDLPRP